METALPIDRALVLTAATGSAVAIASQGTRGGQPSRRFRKRLIRAGQYVKASDGLKFGVDGALRVLGEKDKQVLMTSLRDDAADAGGDVDGSAVPPAPGDWKGVYFQSGSNDRLSQVKNLVLRYPVIGMQFTDVSPTVEGARISDTSDLGISCEGSAKPTLTDVTYSHTGHGDTNCH